MIHYASDELRIVAALLNYAPGDLADPDCVDWAKMRYARAKAHRPDMIGMLRDLHTDPNVVADVVLRIGGPDHPICCAISYVWDAS